MIKERWEQMSTREQQMVSVMTVVVMITLIYFLLWEPLQVSIEDGRARYEAQTRTLLNMQQQAVEVRSLRATGAGRAGAIRDSSTLLGLIERTARQNQLQNALQKVQPDGQDGVRIWMDNIAFDQLIQWLSTLISQHGLLVSEISFERQDAPGRVNSRILLQVRH